MRKNTLFSTLCLMGGLLLTPTVYAGKGVLTITTDPGGAKIYINGKRKGTSPKEKGQSFAVKLDEGEYTVTAYGESLSPLWVKMGEADDVFVGADSRQPLTLKLDKLKFNPDSRIKELIAITDNYRSQSGRQQDFVPQGDGTVLDKRTGLQWMRCSVGQSWTGTTCSGKPDKYEWQQANGLHSDFAGHSDWRLPTRFELETLVYCSSGKDKGRDGEAKQFDLNGCAGKHQWPTIVQTAFPNTADTLYWSASPDSSDTGNAWFVYFGDGESYYGYRYYYGHVRLVRFGQ